MDPELAAIATIALLLLVKESGLPIPVPGDLLVLGAGVAAAASAQPPVAALAILVVATVAGGLVQFQLARGAARPILLRILGRLGVDENTISRLAAPLRRRGARGVAIARMTPGVRIVTVPAAALAALPLASFAAGLTVGNAVFVGGHFALGFMLGEPAMQVAGSALGPLGIVFLVLAGIGLLVWLVLLRRRRTPSALGNWTDAACPACLAVAAVRA